MFDENNEMLTIGYNGSSRGNVPLLTVRDVPSALIVRLLLESVCHSSEEHEWAQLGKTGDLELKTKERRDRARRFLAKTAERTANITKSTGINGRSSLLSYVLHCSDIPSKTTRSAMQTDGQGFQLSRLHPGCTVKSHCYFQQRSQQYQSVAHQKARLIQRIFRSASAFDLFPLEAAPPASADFDGEAALESPLNQTEAQVRRFSATNSNATPATPWQGSSRIPLERSV
jgi:hypothetical protein